MKEYYHICSRGLETNDIFISEKDFIVGINDIALCVLKYDIRILALCLMNNHFHFILEGPIQQVETFAYEYKRRTAMRMRIRNSEIKAMTGTDIQINPIESQEYLMNAIAYVLRNPLAARIMIMPYHYKWSSASVYFKNGHVEGDIKLNSLSVRKRASILLSKQVVPEHYVANNKGMIMMECFIDAKQVEEIFGHPSKLMFLMAKKLETEVELKFGIANMVSVSDEELKTLTLALIKEEYKALSISQLTLEQRICLCLQMKRNFGASPKQIARILRLGVDVVTKVV